MDLNLNKIIPVILSGGEGTRLWPLSRRSYPKQFLNLQFQNQYSLFQATQKRISSLEGIQEPMLICNEEHRFIIAEQMREINVKPQSIILEPCGRNTAPAITIAALKALENEDDPILLILASDHNIKDTENFNQVIRKSVSTAQEGKLVTFGIIPKSPEVGYGYIQSYDELDNEKLKGSTIKKFIEKPELSSAEIFIKDKTYTWNSGIFLFKAKSILKEIKKYQPQIINYCQKSLIGNSLDLDFQRINKKYFEQCPNISIDIAVMEKTNKGYVFPLDAGWSDVGDWKSVWENSTKDNNGNSIYGKIVTEDTRNCYLRSENSLIATLGIENLVIVDTGDAILVSDINQTQKLKNIVKRLNTQNFPEGHQHKKIYRPWGFYLSIVKGPRWQVKLINVDPGGILSLQMHHHRSEHWIVVSGTAEIEVDNKKTLLNENQSTYIPVCSTHRLSNPGKIPLELIEVQSGPYLGEDDITRFDDAYSRFLDK